MSSIRVIPNAVHNSARSRVQPLFPALVRQPAYQLRDEFDSRSLLTVVKFCQKLSKSTLTARGKSAPPTVMHSADYQQLIIHTTGKAG